MSFNTPGFLLLQQVQRDGYRHRAGHQVYDKSAPAGHDPEAADIKLEGRDRPPSMFSLADDRAV